MSDSVRPHKRQPTRLPCPWDSPGKNAGVGCHFLLQCVKVKSLSRVRLLATPWTAAHQAPPSMGFARQEDWSGVPLPSLIARASQRWWASCSYGKCPQGGSTSSCSALVPPVTSALRKVSFLGCNLEWSVPEQAPKPFYLTTSSPLKLLPSPLASCFTWAVFPAGVPRRLHSQGVLSWGPQHGETCDLGSFLCSSKSEGRAIRISVH